MNVEMENTPTQKKLYKFKDKIHNKKILLELDDEVRRFMYSSIKNERREQNKYNYYTSSFDEVVDEDNDEDIMSGEEVIADPNYKSYEDLQDEFIENLEYEHKRFLVSEAMQTLTDTQKLYVSFVFFQNKSYQEIADILGITKQSVRDVIRAAIKNIQNYIKDTQFDVIF